ncbi:MAG: hypothetical protein ACE5JL_08965 [Dehalococcoidia bacterium]
MCGKEVPYWLRREGKIYCVSCFKSALEDRAGLSTHATEEANLFKDLAELSSQEK